MSDDQEDPAKEALLRQKGFFVSRVDYDLTHRNVETRLIDLRRDVDGQRTRLESIDHVVNNMIAEHSRIERRVNSLEYDAVALKEETRVARNERIALLAIVQDVQSFMHAAGPRLMRRVTWTGVVIGVLLTFLILKDFILPAITR
jgi:hypothetical protein